MLKLLKALGLDIPAQVERLRARVEERVGEATERAKTAAIGAAITAALGAFALVTALAAIGVGFTALYHWVAEKEGAYAGYGVVGGLLLAVTIILGAAAWARTRAGQASAPWPHGAAQDAGVRDTTVQDGAATQPSPAAAAAATGAAAPSWEGLASSASTLLELLAFVVPLLAQSPTVRNAVSRMLPGTLGSAGRASTRETLERGAAVIREGDRANLLAVLAGAVLLGWMLTRQSRR